MRMRKKLIVFNLSNIQNYFNNYKSILQV